MTVSAWLELDKRVYGRGEVLQGRVTLITKKPMEVECEVRWVDVYGRLVDRFRFREKLPNNRYIGFSFELRKALTVKNRLECEVYSVSGETLFKTQQVFIVTPDPEPWDDYVVLIWNPGRTREYLEKIKALGINAGLVHSPPPGPPPEPTPYLENLLDTNLRFYLAQLAPRWLAFYHQTGRRGEEWQPLRDAYKATRDKHLLVRKNCLNDPVVAMAYKARIQDIVRCYMPYGPLWYDISDEAGIGDLVGPFDFCFCPHCLNKMRDWLRKVYGSIEALNEEWGTSFKSWDEVEPMTTEEVRRRGDYNLAPWADHRTFMEITFAEAFRVCRDWVREVDPTRPVGLTGGQMPSAYGGYDWWRLTRLLDFIEAYNIGNSREVIRSFGGKRIVHVITLFDVGDEAKWMLWHHLLHGDRGVILWDYDDGVGKRYVVEPSLEINPKGLEMKETFLELRGGIAKLLSLAEFEDDLIAIHYSQSSIHAHWMLETEDVDIADRSNFDERARSEFVRLRESLLKLLEDLGLQYRFVSYEEVENGELTKRRYRVFIMPRSIALSRKEVERIREYVESGGVVIADGLVGLMDGHCKRLDRGLLDDLFGVSRSSVELKPRKSRPGVEVKSVYGRFKPERRRFEVPVLEQSLSENGSRALCEDANGVKALFVKKHGEGLAIYLNLDLADYCLHRLREGGGRDHREIFRMVLEAVGVRPEIGVLNTEGGEVYGCEVFRWRNKAALYVGLLKNPSLTFSDTGPELVKSSERVFRRETRVRLRLPRRFHVYDIRERKYLGYVDVLETTVPAYEPRLLALTPYRVVGITLYVKNRVRPGESVPVRASLVREPENFNDTVFRMEVYDPEGRLVEYYSGKHKAVGGVLETEIHLALNDPEGLWKVKLRDVESGVEREAVFKVEKSK